MKTTEKIAASIVQKMVAREKTEWPPVCGGIIYQPERPVVDIPQQTEAENRMNKKKK